MKWIDRQIVKNMEMPLKLIKFPLSVFVALGLSIHFTGTSSNRLKRRRKK